MKEEGSVVLNGTDVKSAKAGAYQDQTSGASKNVVELSMTKEGTQKLQRQQRLQKRQMKPSRSIMMGN